MIFLQFNRYMKIQKNIRKKLLFYVGFLLIVLSQSCQFVVKEFSMPYSSEDVEKLTDDEKLWCLNRSVDRLDCECATVILESGVDPDSCEGRFGWIDSNPLMILADSRYDVFIRLKTGDTIPSPTPDMRMFDLLLLHGADVNKRPYVWYIVTRTKSDDVESLWQSRLGSSENGKPLVDASEKDEFWKSSVEDENRLLRAFLKAGADPDMLGHQYPFSYEAMEAGITDEQAKKYFDKGTRAINEAIEKGMAWESQVDLLLQYTKLDEESLNAAQRSGDPEMIKKIQKLWEKQ